MCDLRNLVRASLGAIVLVCGCGQSCKNDKPYVPYSVDPSAHPSAAPANLPPPSVSASADPLTNPPGQRFAPVKARKLKPGTSRLTTGAGTFLAPPGFTCDSVLEADLDSDGAQDAAAWITSTDASTGQLVWFGPGKDARTLASPPASFTGAGCKVEPDLLQIGPHTLLVTVRRTCPADSAPAPATKWWSVVVPARTPAERLTLTTVDQRSSERLDVQVDALDRDGDQLDDVLVTLAMLGPDPGFDEDSSPAISVDLAYFDRPAGLSRDPHEPAASFRSIADKLARQVKTKKARGSVGPSARRVRELFRSICGEWGAAALEIGGAPLQCGAGDAMDRVDRADLEAALQDGDLLKAIATLSRIAREPGAQHGTVPDELRSLVTKSWDIKEVDSYHLPFVPEPATAKASWGGLSFDTSGALLIRTASSVLRFDARTRVALPDGPEGPTAPWPLEVASPDGTMTLQSVYDPCDGGPLRLTMRTTRGMLDQAMPVDPMPGNACSKGSLPPMARWRASAWTKAGLELLVEGIPVTVAPDGKRIKAARLPAQPGTRAGARSPDGTTLAIETAEGVAVVPDLGKPQLWRVKGSPDAHLRLHDCVAAPAAAAVACVDGNRTRVMIGSSQ
jgi:hypothetical protein